MREKDVMTNKAMTQLRVPCLALVAGLAVAISGCAIEPKPYSDTEFRNFGSTDRGMMFRDQTPIAKPMTLAEVVTRVLEYNLDKRAKLMEEAFSLGQLKVDRFDVLPKLVANAGYSGRSEFAASTSTDLVTGQPSDANPTYSQDRDRVTSDLGLTWNILDFGVSYYNGQQNADRALIAAERRRKTVANLIQEARFAFWRAAAAQELADKVSKVITTAETALANSGKVEKEQLKNPLESLRYQKTLLENLRLLEGIDQELRTANTELAALINVAPGTRVELKLPPTIEVPNLDLSLEQMEEIAFTRNPDLREQVYQKRITIDETRKVILKMLPGISFSASRQYDNNSFLMANHWNEVGARVTWNLLNILSAPQQIAQAENAEQVSEAKRLALRMAVLAQVHVGIHQFEGAIKQFRRADQLWKVETRLAKATAEREESDAQSVLDRISSETSAVAAHLRRYQTYAQLQLSFGKLQATMGEDGMPKDVAEQTAAQAPAKDGTLQTPVAATPSSGEPGSLVNEHLASYQQWRPQARKDHYVIQLTRTKDQDISQLNQWLVQARERLQTNEIRVYQAKDHKQRQWIGAVFGDFSTAAEANAQLEKLRQLGFSPTVRKVASLPT